jgi:HK97 family phage portal protein
VDLMLGRIGNALVKPFRRSTSAGGAAYFPYGPQTWNLSQFGPMWGGKPGEFGPAYACVQVLAQELARLDVHHYVEDASGRRQRQTNTAVARVLRRPHPHMSRVEWIHYVQRALLTEGNGLALASRDGNGAVRYLVPQGSGTLWPYVVSDTGELWYRKITGLDMLQRDPDPGEMVPGRDVFHVRANCPMHPLVGESPLKVAEVAIKTGQAINQTSHQFFANGAVPSGILRTPSTLTREQFERIKASWQANYGGGNRGGTAVLDADMSYQQITLNPVDADVVRQYQLSVEQVAQVYRVPLPMLGDLSRTSFNNVKELLRAFYNGGLGFYVKAWETSLERFFDLPPNESIEFDVEGGLLREDVKTRMEALAKGVQGGIITPNEARASERRVSLDGGDTLLVQRQMVPIDRAGEDPAPAAPTTPEDDSDGV